MSADDIKATVAIVVAFIALVGVIVTSAVSLVISRRSAYLSAVTVERSKWIGTLRANITALLSTMHAMDIRLYRDEEEFSESEEYDRLRRDAVEKMTLVRLQLNPDGEVDENVLELMTALRRRVGQQDYHEVEELFARHVQWLLKDEWEKVKYEARGSYGRLWAAYKAWRRRRAYKRFCAGDGSVTFWAQ